jgi:preprotein translocase subunit SecA
MLGFLSRFVDSNDRELKRIQSFVDETNDLEEEIKALTDAEIRERFTAIRDEFRETVLPEEPSEDELHHPDMERRRELAKARRLRENQAIRDALDDVVRRSATRWTTSCRRSSRWLARRWSERSGCGTSTSS